MSRKSTAEKFSREGYEIQVVGRNVMVTDAMKQYAMDKIAKVERFSNRIIDVVITMDIQKLEQRVDIVLNVDSIKIKSHAASTDMYASIDKAIDKIQRQLRRYKKKLREHTAKNLSTIDLKVNVLKRPDEEEVIDVNLDIEDESRRQLEDRYRPHEIVAQETRPLKNLTYDEAVMKMELSGDTFLIFRAEDDQFIKVIYRRDDDNYGVIELEA